MSRRKSTNMQELLTREVLPILVETDAKSRHIVTTGEVKNQDCLARKRGFRSAKQKPRWEIGVIVGQTHQCIRWSSEYRTDRRTAWGRTRDCCRDRPPRYVNWRWWGRSAATGWCWHR